MGTRGHLLNEFRPCKGDNDVFSKRCVNTMKTVFLALSLLLISTFIVSGQKVDLTENKVTDAQWGSLFSALEKEEWKDAFDLSSRLLDQLKNDDDANSVPNLRYMLIYSAAGAVSVGKMSYDNLEKQLRKVVGKKIATPFHPLGIDCRPPMFNSICKTKEGEYDASITTTNRLATSILAFEYIKLAKKFDIPKYQGEMAAVLGTVDRIVPNPNRSNLVILRIFTKDAEIVLQKDMDSQNKTAILVRPNLND
jgi:hypothetical protein